MKLRPAVVATLLLVAAIPGSAHHGAAGFDKNKPVHFVGTISSVEWTNPHVVIHLDVANAEGKVTTWLINTTPPNAANRMGFPRNAFATGTVISVDGYQAIDGSSHVNGTNIVFPDGRQIVSPDCFEGAGYCYKATDGGFRVQ